MIDRLYAISLCIVLGVIRPTFAGAAVTATFGASSEIVLLAITGRSGNDLDAQRFYDLLSVRPYYDSGESVKSGTFYGTNGQRAFYYRCNSLQLAAPDVNCMVVIYRGDGAQISPDSSMASYVPQSAYEANQLAALFLPTSAGSSLTFVTSAEGNLFRIPAFDPGHPTAFGLFYQGH